MVVPTALKYIVSMWMTSPAAIGAAAGTPLPPVGLDEFDFEQEEDNDDDTTMTTKTPAPTETSTSPPLTAPIAPTTAIGSSANPEQEIGAMTMEPAAAAPAIGQDESGDTTMSEGIAGSDGFEDADLRQHATFVALRR